MDSRYHAKLSSANINIRIIQKLSNCTFLLHRLPKSGQIKSQRAKSMIINNFYYPDFRFIIVFKFKHQPIWLY